MTSFSKRNKKYRSRLVDSARSSFSSGAWRYITLSASGCSEEVLWGVMTPCGWLACGLRKSDSWPPRVRAAASEPMREPASSELASSSSAAALTLALSSGRNDSFSSSANVVPDAMLFPSRLGGFVAKSETDCAFRACPVNSVWFGGVPDIPLPSTTRLRPLAEMLSPCRLAAAASTVFSMLDRSISSVLGFLGKLPTISGPGVDV